MRCKICHEEFQASKYQPKQEVCSKLECQKQRQIRNQKDWRLKNPDYFKCLGQEASWKDKRYRYSRLWKTTHQKKLQEYEQNHLPQRRQYMREYMRRYRELHNVNRSKS